MSYILEALKKADAERKLGAVPGLHVHPVSTVAFDDKLPLLRRPLIWAAVGLFWAIAILLAWYRPWTSPAVSASEEPEVQAIAPAKPAIAANTVEPARPAAPVALAAAVPQKSLQNLQSETAPAKEAKAKKPESERNKITEKQGREAPDAVNAAQAQPAEKPVMALAPIKPLQGADITGQAQSAEMQVAALRDLPEHVQRSLPQVTVGGYIYSSNPSGRSMLINNRLVKEGDTVSSGLVLEKMLPNREAVLNFQGQRYRLSY